MIVHVTLTPYVDTDQSDSLKAQIAAAPDGTFSNPTIIDLPLGRYRIDKGVVLSHRNHIRLTCLAAVPTYPSPPTDSQAFVAYTDKTGLFLGIKYFKNSTRTHFAFVQCTNVVGSFLRIEGPHIERHTDYTNQPNYPTYRPTLEGEHAFHLSLSTDSGFEDCSYQNVWADGLFVGGTGLPNTNRNVHCHRLTGHHHGRMGLGIVNCDGLEVVDANLDWSGWGGLDIEPSLGQITWNTSFTRCALASWYYPVTFGGWNPNAQTQFGYPSSWGNLEMKDCRVIRAWLDGVPTVSFLTFSHGFVIIDGMTDLRNKVNYAYWWPSTGSNRCYGDVTITNCRSTERSNLVSHAIAGPRVSGTLTITNNDFSGVTPGPGTVVSTGFDHLYSNFGSGGAPQAFIHHGNVWGNGELNDGLATPGVLELEAIAGELAIEGGSASLLTTGNQDLFAAAGLVAIEGGAAFLDVDGSSVPRVVAVELVRRRRALIAKRRRMEMP